MTKRSPSRHCGSRLKYGWGVNPRPIGLHKGQRPLRKPTAVAKPLPSLCWATALVLRFDLFSFGTSRLDGLPPRGPHWLILDAASTMWFRTLQYHIFPVRSAVLATCDLTDVSHLNRIDFPRNAAHFLLPGLGLMLP